MPVWVHNYRRRVALKDPQLWGAHVGSDGTVWVWGQVGGHSYLNDLPPNGLLVRAWDGTTWANRDRLNPEWPAGAIHPPDNEYHAVQMLSLYARPADSAFSSSDLIRGSTLSPPTHHVAVWTGSTWTDELSEEVCYLVGTGPSDIYALMQFPLDGDAQSVNWRHWDGSTWGVLQSDFLTNIGTNFFWGGTVGSFPYVTGGFGRLADICPDGVIFYAGAQIDAPQHKVLARVDPGVSADLVLDADPGYFHAVWCAANDAVYVIIEVTGVSRGVYLWDRSGSPTWTLIGGATWGWGKCIHGVAPDDWWMGLDLDVAHWDGATYTEDTLPDPHPGDSFQPEVRGFWAVSSSDVWAVGRLYHNTTGHYEGVVWHWDGAAWTVHTVFTN